MSVSGAGGVILLMMRSSLSSMLEQILDAASQHQGKKVSFGYFLGKPVDPDVVIRQPYLRYLLMGTEEWPGQNKKGI